MNIDRRMVLLAAAQALLATPTRAAVPGAAAYPDRPVRIVVPYPPGGPSDIVARVLAMQLSVQMSKPFVIDNRPGANGVIGNGLVANSAPDGYTLLLTLDASLTVNPALYANLPYDPAQAFLPVALVADNVNVLVIHRDVPATSARQLVSVSAERPLMLANGGNGTPSHLAAELLRRQTGIKLTTVAYKGSPPALQSVLSGETQGTFAAVSAAVPHVHGRLRALAVASPRRSPLLPDVPTMREAGIPGVETDGWFGLLAPAGPPDAIRARLIAAVNAALDVQELRNTLLRQGIAPLGGTPETMTRRMIDESRFWAGLIGDAGIKVE